MIFPTRQTEVLDACKIRQDEGGLNVRRQCNFTRNEALQLPVIKALRRKFACRDNVPQGWGTGLSGLASRSDNENLRAAGTSLE
jgi:hypothetical protein